MKFSLILATYNTPENYLIKFINSIINQSFQDYELLIIDQNKDDRVLNILYKYDSLKYRYIKTNIVGLSHARNIGLNEVSGDIISFPDDDCSYPDILLSDINEYLKDNEHYDFISLKTLDEKTNEQLSYTPFLKPTIINKTNIFHSVTSIGLFIRKRNMTTLPQFDEKFGLGSQYFSSEEMDYVHHLILDGYDGIYLPYFFVFHPKLPELFEPNVLYKIKNNSLGHGAYYKKHFIKNGMLFKWIAISTIIIRPLGGLFLSILSFNKMNCRKYYYIFIGRLVGFIRYNNDK